MNFEQTRKAYSISFYHEIGFSDLDIQQDIHGILYTPMEFML
ncbi:GNAT family N-acetyltransferase [Clostridium bowmanii]|nr:GNAT family N-acetyltransferase [Clostridium bowmanii]MCA1076144.1 GNAT family N-acetyltransferase [Clostridium bowmanii]